MKQTKPKFAVGQIVDKDKSGLVSVLERRWAGHCWYYRILYLSGVVSWVLESQLLAPIGATV